MEDFDSVEFDGLVSCAFHVSDMNARVLCAVRFYATIVIVIDVNEPRNSNKCIDYCKEISQFNDCLDLIIC